MQPREPTTPTLTPSAAAGPLRPCSAVDRVVVRGVCNFGLSPATAQTRFRRRRRRPLHHPSKQREQEWKRPYAAKERGRRPGEAEIRNCLNGPGSQQAQSAADRHRGPGAQCRNPIGEPKHGCDRWIPRAAIAVRSIRAAPRLSRCWPPCSARVDARHPALPGQAGRRIASLRTGHAAWRRGT